MRKWRVREIKYKCKLDKVLPPGHSQDALGRQTPVPVSAVSPGETQFWVPCGTKESRARSAWGQSLRRGFPEVGVELSPEGGVSIFQQTEERQGHAVFCVEGSGQRWTVIRRERQRFSQPVKSRPVLLNRLLQTACEVRLSHRWERMRADPSGFSGAGGPEEPHWQELRPLRAGLVPLRTSRVLNGKLLFRRGLSRCEGFESCFEQ